MGFIGKLRKAAERVAEKVQAAGRAVYEAAKNAISRGRAEAEEPLYKEETPERPFGAMPGEGVDEFGLDEILQESLSDKLKREDLEAREQAHIDAFNTFNENYFDGDLTREQYDNMWNTIGEFSNDHSEYGSPELVLLYEEMFEKYGEGVNDPTLFEQLFEQASNSINAMYPEDAIDVIYDMIRKMDTLEELHDSLQSIYD